MPESIMPTYAFLLNRKLDTKNIAAHLSVNQTLGVPYSKEMIENAGKDIVAQATPESDDVEGFQKRYAKTNVRDFDGNPNMISEMDALVAYLQMLGTLVDFNAYKPKENLR